MGRAGGDTEASLPLTFPLRGFPPSSVHGRALRRSLWESRWRSRGAFGGVTRHARADRRGRRRFLFSRAHSWSAPGAILAFPRPAAGASQGGKRAGSGQKGRLASSLQGFPTIFEKELRLAPAAGWPLISPHFQVGTARDACRLWNEYSGSCPLPPRYSSKVKSTRAVGVGGGGGRTWSENSARISRITRKNPRCPAHSVPEENSCALTQRHPEN